MEWWQKIRQIRGERKAWDIAYQSGMSESQYNKYETGSRTNPNLKTLKKIAAALQCNVKDFFSDEDVKPRVVREITHYEARLVAMWQELPLDVQKLVIAVAEAINSARSAGRKVAEKQERTYRAARKKSSA